MLDLTVIIACKNRHDNLKYCISSISGCPNWPHVYVVDFGSDPPIKIIEYNWVRVITVTRNTGVFHKARALNIAIKKAKTRYICITDADQIFAPNFFDVVYNTLVSVPNSFVMCKTYGLWKDPIDYGVTPETVVEKYPVLLEAAENTKELYGDGCCHATSTNWFVGTGGYEEQFIGWGCEDSDVAWRAHVTKLKLKNINGKTSMVHLPHPHNTAKAQYHSDDVKRRNKHLYWQRRKNGVARANTGKQWGKP